MEAVINGIKMSYQMAGGGFPLVFVHGFPLSGAMWQPQLEGLADKAQIIVPDLRGFGETQTTSGTYSMDMLANDIAAFLDAQNINAPILCGLSMGGYVSMAFCKRYARWLSGLVLISTRSGGDSEEGKANRDKMIATTKDKGVKAVAEEMLPRLLAAKSLDEKPELVKTVKGIIEKASVEGVVNALAGMKERSDAAGWLPRLDIPTIVIHGAEDTSIPVAEAEALTGLIPGATLKIIADAGHLPNMEQPEKFNEVISEFVNSF